MGFLKKLFGDDQKKDKPYVDKQGIYFFVQCDNCGTIVRVRADKQYDLNREDGGFVWNKTIVDNRCFRRMQAVVYLDGSYHITSQEVSNGRFVTIDEYEAAQKPVEEPVSEMEEEE